jgi:hypothetical protein
MELIHVKCVGVEEDIKINVKVGAILFFFDGKIASVIMISIQIIILCICRENLNGKE